MSCRGSLTQNMSYLSTCHYYCHLRGVEGCVATLILGDDRKTGERSGEAATVNVNYTPAVGQAHGVHKQM